MHIDDLRQFALVWLHKTEEVRADRAHYATNITGDICSSGWISEMYGYSFGAAELKPRHRISSEILITEDMLLHPVQNTVCSTMIWNSKLEIGVLNKQIGGIPTWLIGAGLGSSLHRMHQDTKWSITAGIMRGGSVLILIPSPTQTQIQQMKL